MATTAEKDNELAILKAQVKDLSDKLGKAQTEASGKGGLVLADSEEQPTGRTVDVEVCINVWETDEKKQKFETVKLPTFMYTINLPLSAGTHLSTNGFPYYHGETYELDSQTLPDIKSRVARCWDHEKSIRKSTTQDMNNYIDTRMKSAAAVARSLPQV